LYSDSSSASKWGEFVFEFELLLFWRRRRRGGPGGCRSPSPCSSSSSTLDHAPEEEALFNRINELEFQCLPEIPTQLDDGEYLSSIKENLTSAAAEGEDEYLRILEFETFYVERFERMAEITHKLKNLLIEDPNVNRIVEEATFSNIEKEAVTFVQRQITVLEQEDEEYRATEEGTMQQREMMRSWLNSILGSLEGEGRESPFFRLFLADFMGSLP
jgi:hypothetical protein